MDLPIYKNEFKDQYNNFFDKFKKEINRKKGTIHTNYALQKRWILNSILNFSEVLDSPNLLMLTENPFEGKTAVLVSAGPSLDEEIDNLKLIKKNGLAYIFSVGSSINTLLDYNIIPDAICTYDPKEKNRRVFYKLHESGITDIPMIFGSSIGYEVLQDYKGPKYSMITSQDTLSRLLLNSNSNLRFVNDAPSIAVITLEMLYKLGFSDVILVGQNLALREDKEYANGIHYHDNKNVKKSNEDYSKYIKVKDVYGGEVYTNDMYNKMRHQLETYIGLYSDMKIINGTKGGAYIKGTSFIPLENIIKENLKKKIVLGKEFIELKSDSYNMEYLAIKLEQLQIDYLNIGQIMTDLINAIKTMNNLRSNNNYYQSDKMYSVFDKLLDKFFDNSFAKAVIIPMNRIIYELLLDEISLIKLEKNKNNKIKRTVNIITNFIKVCNDELKNSEELMQEFFTQFHKNRNDNKRLISIFKLLKEKGVYN
nr:6-hydroxymethylpterin diphosphokinase MptE-like protein [Alkalibaculum sporogenes]